MKKLTLTIAIILGITMTTFADSSSLFKRDYNARNGMSGYTYFKGGEEVGEGSSIAVPMLPSHGANNDVAAPLGSGIVALMGLGAAYLVGKKRREE